MNQIDHISEAPLPSRIESALAKVPALLTAGEAAMCIIVQLPWPAYLAWSRRQIVVATNQRLIILARGLFGGFTMRDVQWQDLLDAQVTERSATAVFGCEFFASTKRGRFTVQGLPSARAFGLYRICQEREQEWREKNRVREMEEAHAKAGGLLGGMGMRGGQAGAGAMMQQLQQLQQLRQTGTISDVELESMKAKILAGM
jgi:hypothetical protein